MTTFIDVEDIDTMNLRMFHELTIIEFNIIQFLQHLQLLPTKPKDTDGCNKKCNDWYRAYVEKRGDEGMNLKRMLINQSVFGGIDINIKKCFMVPVQQRDAATLLPVITTYVLPGTTIYSDEWRAYHALQHNPAYQHATVNHSVSFVDSNSGVHTQNIENTWMLVKRKQKKQGEFSRTLVNSYLEKFMWRK
ncbi:unnamed protein product [Rotaria magnacalcarata]|uniref:ISXO2-like transposase domain-containing protein n=2 Tax=Rotaria magnacalcarata TaxID=392030 RepID=A0A815P2P8_9BILA|nr:unnamed protein product [Rotaria magnacalcarata]CAF4022874.1 unnamed protein product [Rotaria magnacalcarata]CAF4050973.1 unnamed protein product [Rotaria magnacalcarata]